MQRFVIGILFLLSSAAIVEAGMIRGTVYDLSMDRASDVTIDISTTPRQRYISKDGTYSFKVIPGNYTLRAQQYKNEEVVSLAAENITVDGNNDYHFDMILFPTIETQDDLLGDSIFDIEKITLEQEPTPWWPWLLGGVLLVSIIGGAYIVVTARTKKTGDAMVASTAVMRELDKLTLEKTLQQEPQKENPPELGEQKQEQKDELQEIIDYIKAADGRMTQKDLRKKFPSSEAKISLMLAELEHRGLIEKIKKGRGNIIILREPK
ncbi:hypothetical protein HY639_04530 [Candidatus Woesearchaeota archaeon]|nr:hypothetical protein [Candidatus Woesearchaeota archaeon]